MKIVLALSMSFLFVISFTSFTLANLKGNSDFNSAPTHEKPDLYCGLALPLEGEQGGQDEDTEATDDNDNNDDTQQDQYDDSGSETDSGSGSQSDQEN